MRSEHWIQAWELKGLFVDHLSCVQLGGVGGEKGERNEKEQSVSVMENEIYLSTQPPNHLRTETFSVVTKAQVCGFSFSPNTCFLTNYELASAHRIRLQSWSVHNILFYRVLRSVKIIFSAVKDIKVEDTTTTWDFWLVMLQTLQLFKKQTHFWGHVKSALLLKKEF